MPAGSGTTTVNGPTTTRSYNNTTQPYPGIVSTVVQLFGSGSWARNSSNTPGYAVLAATGKLPENSFGYSETYKTVLNGTQLLRTQNTATRWSATEVTGRIGGLWNHAVPWNGTYVSALRANSYNKVIAKINDKMMDSDIDLSVVAGEFRETAHMFGDFAKRLKAAYGAARRGNISGVASALSVKNSKDWANAWLLAQYGIRPFVNDLYGACKALEKGMMKERYTIVRSGDSYSDTKSYTTGSLAAGIWTVDWKLKVDVSARVKYTIVDPTMATLASLGLLNPLSLAWELKKLSFVIDWGVGIGNWLQQLGASAGKTFDTGSVTYFTRTTGRASYDRYSTGSSSWTVHGRQEYDDVLCNRIGIGSFPVAYLPALKDPISKFTVATGIALLRQRN